jgi:hypothetical protein
MLRGPGAPETSNGGIIRTGNPLPGGNARRRRAPLRQRDDGGDHDQRHDRHQQQADRPEPVERRRMRCHAGQGGTLGEGRNIAAARQVDADGVVGAEPRVIAIDGAAQPRRLDADDRIELRIEFGVAAQHVDADRIGLNAVALALQHRLDNEAQECAQLRRAIEIVARRHAFELGPDLVRGRQIAGRFVHRSGNPQISPVRGH